jgi:6-phosphofructokinase 1
LSFLERRIGGLKRVAILTGGGDAPGLNAVIRAVTTKATKLDYEVLGIRRGWAGLIDIDLEPLDLGKVEDIHRCGGTIILTSRTNPYKIEDGVKRLCENFKKMDLTGLIAAGGEDTLGVANRLYKEEHLPIVGVPKTIDNDLSGTDQTFGFDTAVEIATDAIDRLHTTARSHQRIMVVEVMGRHAGWITLKSGMAGGAHFILIPEVAVDLDKLCDGLKRRYEEGKDYAIVAVAEGVSFTSKKGAEEHVLQTDELDEFGHVRLGGVGKFLEKKIKEKTGLETRSVVLGHLQRGGPPSAFDRNLGTSVGLKAMDLVESGDFGKMATLYHGKITVVSLDEAVGKLKVVDKSLYEEAELFFG